MVDKKKERYLVTGGSGFLGINLIRYLLKKGHDVTNLDLVEFDYPEKPKIRSIRGDIRIRKDVEDAMKDIDIVVHCAAALPLYSKEEIFSTDIEGTKLVLEIANKNNVERFIHISTTAVYGIPDHHPLFEEDKLDGVGNYGIAKIEAEKACLAYRDRGMVVPIVRPKSFIGPERLGVFAILYDWAKDGRHVPIIGSGKNRYQLLDVEDLCDAIYLCAKLEKSKVNDIFNIGAGEFTTMREDYQAVLDEAGFKRRIVGLPAWPAIWTLRLLEIMHLSPLYKWVYETAPEDSFVSIEKAKKKLGYSPKYSNKDALRRNYQWYIKNLHKFKGQSGVTHRVPWKQGILSVVKWFF
ncbi:NAD-dependent epimerase/dehydratase family protein [Candidatus Woesearchaeota archaeon]|nr:NAD-dependent epimerase/dehydratase family protein [Candidatus Woesearchaeota archaeon]